MSDKRQLTQILNAASSGDPAAANTLVDLVYQELHVLAQRLMRGEQTGHTLQPTALVNEAYMRLLDGKSEWENRRHFFGAAARAMRRVLVDHARKRNAAKRGGGVDKITLDGLEIAAPESAVDLLALNEALEELALAGPRLGRIVELRYFGGLSIEETAAVMEVSAATVKRDWQFARAWLQERLQTMG